MDYYTEYLTALSRLISYKSVLQKGQSGAPFGKEVNAALEYFLALAKEYGFTTVNYDGYAGEIVFGEGEEIGIMGHIDVVPAGDGWNTDPFTLTLKDGYLYGRGVLDDKGPLLAAFFALKKIKDAGIVPKRKFRLFIGTNEESGWQDAEYLKTKTVLPEYGFSPDGNFPVSYAEKGMAIIKFKLPRLKNFYDVNGGTVINAVCGYASAKEKTAPDLSLINKYGLKVNGGVIESVGKAAHGSRPDLGVNAIKPLFEYFAARGEDLTDAIECLFSDKFGLTSLKSEQGNITFSPDIIEEKDGSLYIYCDCRFPYPFSERDIIAIIDKFGIDYELSVKHGTQYVEKDGFLVSALLCAYKSVMGGSPCAISQGGSTFARVFNKGVAFGPEFPDVPSTIHEPNEKVSEKDLMKIFEIYEKAVLSLAIEQ